MISLPYIYLPCPGGSSGFTVVVRVFHSVLELNFYGFEFYTFYVFFKIRDFPKNLNPHYTRVYVRGNVVLIQHNLTSRFPKTSKFT